MSLADYFPEHLRKGYAARNLSVGTVLKLRVKDTNPPKEKRLIVVGFTDDNLFLATIFINSRVNPNLNLPKELQELHLHFKAEEREYLEWDSFVDCSQIAPRNYSEIAEAIENRPESIIGNVSQADLEEINEKIISAPTIKGKIKKRFGFYK